MMSDDTLPRGFSVQPLPWHLRLPTALADGLGIGAPRLTPENLMRAARRWSGSSLSLPTHVGEALEVLCRSWADEADLHWFGRMNVWSLTVTGLRGLLAVEEAHRADPTLSTDPLIPPLVVTGLPRSGTTFLHRLLSAVSEAEGIALYQHIYPGPGGGPARRLARAERIFAPWKQASQSYNMDAIHLVRPPMPDECNFGMRLGGRSMIFWAMASTPGYMEWLLGQDLRETYQMYRRVLQVHQRQAPGQRLVLKCPHHLAWLPALVEALPEALIVQTHRHPLQVVPSESKLVLSLHGLSTHRLDWERTVRFNALKVRTYAQRSVAFSREAGGQRILHVDYRGLVSDPVAVAEDIHQRFGLPFGETHRQQLASFHQENRQHKHGRNRYSLEQFELDGDQIEEAFAPYIERFFDDEGAPLFGFG